MEISDIVIGVLGRLVIPGRQHVGVLWTILVGIAGTFAGTGIAAAFDGADTNGVDWIEWLIQIGLAALGVAALNRVRPRRHCWPLRRVDTLPPSGRWRRVI